MRPDSCSQIAFDEALFQEFLLFRPINESKAQDHDARDVGEGENKRSGCRYVKLLDETVTSVQLWADE